MKYQAFKEANTELGADPLVAWMDDPNTTELDLQNEIGVKPWMTNFDNGENKSQSSSF